MLEIEMKFPIADFSSIVQHLQRWNATSQPTIEEADHYFNGPDRDFARTDEAFRLRLIGDENRVTYKGPKETGQTKTRIEIEIALEPGAETADQWRRMVQHLGYRPTAVVKKRRTIHKFQRDGFAMEVCLDEVETLGKFVEVEIIADVDDKQRAQQVLLDAAHELGLEESEPRSYLEMVLSRSAGGSPAQ